MDGIPDVSLAHSPLINGAGKNIPPPPLGLPFLNAESEAKEISSLFKLSNFKLDLFVLFFFDFFIIEVALA